MSEIVNYIIPEDFETETLLQELKNSYNIIEEESRNEACHYYDSFDWRLFNEGLVLFKKRGRLFLRRLNSDRPLQTLPFTGNPAYPDSFPESSLRKRIIPILEMRALIAQAQTSEDNTTFKVLNADEKTILRFVLKNVYTGSGRNMRKRTSCMILRGVRGYTDICEQFQNNLQSAGLVESAEDDYLLTLRGLDKKPGQYTSKIKITLDRQMPAFEALRHILKYLLNIIVLNEKGIKQDIDTEFLHDFRVAVRRTRSALSQLKKLLPKDEGKKFKADFKYLGRLTNELRDLDVYLLNRKKYITMLPAELQADLDLLFRSLTAEREKQHRKITLALNSAKYRQVIRDWKSFLSSDADKFGLPPATGEPIIGVARKTIYKKYKQVISLGQEIIQNNDSEKLHTLRIDCKELRYLMEFFSSLFPEKDIGYLLRQLKRLQDNLGDFNDFHVQQEKLKGFLDTLPPKDSGVLKTALAIGCLVGNLHTRQQQVQFAFSETFKQFAGADNLALARKLFKNGEGNKK